MRLSNNTKLYVGIVIALIIGVAVGYFARARMTKMVDVEYQMIMSALTGTFEGGNYAGGLMEQWIGLCNLPSFGNRAQRLRGVRRFYAVTTRAEYDNQSLHSAAMPKVPSRIIYETCHCLRLTRVHDLVRDQVLVSDSWCQKT